MWGGGRPGVVFFFQAEDGIRDDLVTGVQTCALPISGVEPGVPCGTVSTTLPLPSACGVRHAGNRQAPGGPDLRHRRGGPLPPPPPLGGLPLPLLPLFLRSACPPGPRRPTIL